MNMTDLEKFKIYLVLGLVAFAFGSFAYMVTIAPYVVLTLVAIIVVGGGITIVLASGNVTTSSLMVHGILTNSQMKLNQSYRQGHYPMIPATGGYHSDDDQTNVFITQQAPEQLPAFDMEEEAY